MAVIWVFLVCLVGGCFFFFSPRQGKSVAKKITLVWVVADPQASVMSMAPTPSCGCGCGLSTSSLPE